MWDVTPGLCAAQCDCGNTCLYSEQHQGGGSMLAGIGMFFFSFFLLQKVHQYRVLLLVLL